MNGNVDTNGNKLLGNDYIRLAMQYGFPGVVALILLFALLGIFETPLTKSVLLLEAQAQVQTRHSEETARLQRMLMRALMYQGAILRQSCIQAATNQQDRRLCDPIQVIPTE